MKLYVRSAGKLYGKVSFDKIHLARLQGLLEEDTEVSEDRIEWLALHEAESLLNLVDKEQETVQLKTRNQNTDAAAQSQDKPRENQANEENLSNNGTEATFALRAEPQQPGHDEKLCPYCGSLIKKKAVFCRFCRQDIVP